MVKTDIRKADKSRKIVAYVMDGDEITPVALEHKGGRWEMTVNCDWYETYEIKAWEYVFKPPEKTSELRKQYNKLEHCNFDQEYLVLLDMLIDKLEELDGSK